MATAVGRLNAAALGAPSANPLVVVVPARVITSLVEVSTRMRLLNVSAMRTSFVGVTKTPYGYWKRADEAGPSVAPTDDPAAVETTAPGEIMRMRALPLSATYSEPSDATASPRGLLNVELAAGPSDAPATPVPA